jgi:hypothetical protein
VAGLVWRRHSLPIIRTANEPGGKARIFMDSVHFNMGGAGAALSLQEAAARDRIAICRT